MSLLSVELRYFRDNEQRGNIISCGDLLVQCVIGEKMHRNITVGRRLQVWGFLILNTFQDSEVQLKYLWRTFFFVINIDIIQLLKSYQFREDSVSPWEILVG